MRWDALFSDLAGQADALERGQREQEIADRYRIEVGAVTLRGRLSASVGHSVQIQLATGRSMGGVIDQVGSDWMLVRGDGGRESVVALGAVQGVRGLGRSSVLTEESAVDGRLGIRSVLRAIARHRSTVSIDLIDRSTSVGMIDRVGVDHCDLTARNPDRPGDLRTAEFTVIALAAVVTVTRQTG